MKTVLSADLPETFPGPDAFQKFIYRRWPAARIEYKGNGIWDAQLRGNSPVRSAQFYEDDGGRVTWHDRLGSELE